MTELPGKWTIEKLRSLSRSDRNQLWRNAKVSTLAGANELATTIENLGLPYGESGGMSDDDPVRLAIYACVFSPEGRAACLRAHADGLPAVAGVDPLLQTQLGSEYFRNHATQTAGSDVADLMRSLGYVHAGQRDMPAGCVAKTGAIWKMKGS